MFRKIASVVACFAVTACAADFDHEAPVADEQPDAEEQVGSVEEALSAGPHYIKNRWSWSCMDIPDGASANRTPVNQYWPCHGGPNQQFTAVAARDRYGWTGYQLRNVYTGKCVTIDGDPAPGDEVFQYTCSPANDTATNQLFEIRSKGATQIWRGQQLFEIRAPWYPNKCLDVPGGTLDTVQLQMFQCHRGPNQAWNVSSTYHDPS
jgi:hypothetical protein